MMQLWNESLMFMRMDEKGRGFGWLDRGSHKESEDYWITPLL